MLPKTPKLNAIHPAHGRAGAAAARLLRLPDSGMVDAGCAFLWPHAAAHLGFLAARAAHLPSPNATHGVFAPAQQVCALGVRADLRPDVGPRRPDHFRVEAAKKRPMRPGSGWSACAPAPARRDLRGLERFLCAVKVLRRGIIDQTLAVAGSGRSTCRASLIEDVVVEMDGDARLPLDNGHNSAAFCLCRIASCLIAFPRTQSPGDIDAHRALVQTARLSPGPCAEPQTCVARTFPSAAETWPPESGRTRARR